MTSTVSRFVEGRPLVVLAGWLGCQPRSLRRYEALYSRLGWGVVTRIAAPSLVVAAAQSPPKSEERPRPSQAPAAASMNELAWDTLREVEASRCSVFIMHVFSNGGCFLWEQVRHILSSEQSSGEPMDTLRDKLAGVVFDSSPAVVGLDGLYRAMQYSSWLDRVQFHAQRVVEASLGEEAQLLRERRAFDYWMGIRNDPWELPQLYLYSEDDGLTPYAPLQELVDHRQGIFGPKVVFHTKFRTSPHCCHVLTHPNEYQVAVENFLDRCLFGTNGDAPPPSRL